MSGSARTVVAMRIRPLTALADAVAPALDKHRELLDAACTWQATRSRHVDPALFALICAAVDAAPGVTPTRWTRTGACHAVRLDIPNWCSRNRCLWPDEILDALWEWFDFLHTTGRLDPTSDPLAELRKPLICYGWLDQDGVPMPRDAPRQVECECLLPYRETTQLLGELVLRSECAGRLPIDVLRELIRDTPLPHPRYEWPGGGWWDGDRPEGRWRDHR